MAITLFSKNAWLEKEIENLRRRLHEAIENRESYRKILYLSQKLDRLLVLHYRHDFDKKDR